MLSLQSGNTEKIIFLAILDLMFWYAKDAVQRSKLNTSRTTVCSFSRLSETTEYIWSLMRQTATQGPIMICLLWGKTCSHFISVVIYRSVGITLYGERNASHISCYQFERDSWWYISENVFQSMHFLEMYFLHFVVYKLGYVYALYMLWMKCGICSILYNFFLLHPLAHWNSYTIF